MLKRIIYLVIATLLTACQEPAKTKSISIEAGRSAVEEEALRRAVKNINEQLGQDLAGTDMIKITGIRTDEDGFHWEKDLNDKTNTFYTFHKETPDTKLYIELEIGSSEVSQYDENPYIESGGLSKDVLIFSYNFAPVDLQNEKMDNCKMPEDWPTEITTEPGTPCPLHLQRTITHELCHFIGMGHVNKGESLLYPSSIDGDLTYSGQKFDFSNNEQIDFIKEDKIAFCCKFECLTDEYACTPEALLDLLE